MSRRRVRLGGRTYRSRTGVRPIAKRNERELGPSVRRQKPGAWWPALPPRVCHRAGWYHDTYLFSPHWERVRRRAKVRAKYRCEQKGCRSTGGRLDVHHITYARLGNELPDDVEALCRDCHKKKHDSGEARRFSDVFPPKLCCEGAGPPCDVAAQSEGCRVVQS